MQQVYRKPPTSKKVGQCLKLRFFCLHVHLERYRIEAQEVVRNSTGWSEILRNEWVTSRKGGSDRDYLALALQNSLPLAAEFPSQTRQNEALESVTQTQEQSFSLLIVQLPLLSLAEFPAKTHKSQVCK